MVKRFGFSAAAASLAYVRDNSDVLFVCATAPASFSAASTQPQMIVSANVSGADFTITSAATGALLTVAAKNGQSIEGSGAATHIAFANASASRLNYVANISPSQVLASGNTVNIGSLTITQLACANNS